MRNEIRREGVVRIFDKGTALRAAGVGLLVALVSYASAAGAQSRFWLRDDSSNGIRFGTGRLHTSLEFETRYDSFAGWGQSESGGLEEVGDVVLHVKPRLELRVPSRTLALEGDAGLDYVGYTGAEQSWTSRQSKLNANLGFNGLWNPDGDFRIEIDERFVRSDRTTNYELGVLTISNRNQAELAFDVQPGGGALSLRPSFTNTVEFFEERFQESCPPGIDCQGQVEPVNVNRWNYMTNTIGLNVGYQLSDRSAIVVDGKLGIHNYLEEISQDFDTNNLRATLGFVGLVAPKLELRANVGYGAQLGVEEAHQDNAFSGLIGGAELGYRITDYTRVQVGYRRDFHSSPTQLLHYTNDRIYLAGQWRFIRDFGARLTLAYNMLGFPDDRSDEIFSLAIGPEYMPSDRIAIGASYGYLDRVSSTKSPAYEYARSEFGAYVAVRY